MMNVKGDVKEITRHLNAQQRKIIPLAVPSAINKTARLVNTQFKRSIAAYYDIPQKAFNKKVKIFRANRRKWTAKNWAGLQSKIPVAKVYKSNARQKHYVKGFTTIPANRVFNATMKSGHSGLFYRKGQKRLPIQEIYLDLSRQAPELLARIGPKITQKNFMRLFTHEMKYRLSRKYN